MLHIVRYISNPCQNLTNRIRSKFIENVILLPKAHGTYAITSIRDPRYCTPLYGKQK